MVPTAAQGILCEWDPLVGVNEVPASVPSKNCIEKSLQRCNSNNPHINTLSAAVFYPFFSHSHTSIIVFLLLTNL
jgi:hypothetical protein